MQYMKITNIFFLKLILIGGVYGAEIDGNPAAYRNFRVNMKDVVSGVEINVTYGRNAVDAPGEGQMGIHGIGDTSDKETIKITKEEVKLIHSLMKDLAENFKILDDPDQSAFEKRMDQGQPFLFSVELSASEQSIIYSCSPQDEKNFENIGKCFTYLMDKFSPAWKTKIDWSKKKANPLPTNK